MGLGMTAIAFGLIWIAGILLMQERINNFYQNIRGLSEKQKRHYQKVIVKLPGIFMILVGLYCICISAFPNIKEATENVNWNLIVGCFALGSGMASLMIRLLKKENKLFFKYNAMIATWGKVRGMALHIVAYTIIPLLVGLLLLFRIIEIF